MPACLRQDTISKFVASSLTELSLSPSARILDMPCGFGRHARWLAAKGHAVVGLDIDEERVLAAKAQYPTTMRPIQWVVADIERPLPLLDGSFDVVVVVHYVSRRIIDAARQALRPGGYLIYETFDARGENWRALPHLGAVHRMLDAGFEAIDLRERAVGPDRTHAVVRAQARRT